jgi:hypothetical protein
MKRRALNTEATKIVDNTSTGVRQTIKIQVLSAGNVFISTQENDLQQLTAGGSPVNGLKLSQANSIQDGTFQDFLGALWMRSDVGVDIDVTIFNSPPQNNQKPKRTGPYISQYAPLFGRH